MSLWIFKVFSSIHYQYKQIIRKNACIKVPAHANSLSPTNLPEIGTSPELNTADTTYVQSLIIMYKWVVVLVRVDI